MRNLVIGCALAALVAFTPGSVAKPPASFSAGLLVPLPAVRSDFGIASWYGEKFHGNLTASGEVYDMNGLTAANWDSHFGTNLKITNLQNGRSVVVRINDRGPSVRGRVIDVSRAAATRLGFLRAGLAPVEIRALGGSNDAQPGPVERGSVGRKIPTTGL